MNIFKPHQVKSIKEAIDDITASLTAGQKATIAMHWGKIYPTLEPMQKMVADAILKVIR